jgi:hypothetical protein
MYFQVKKHFKKQPLSQCQTLPKDRFSWRHFKWFLGFKVFKVVFDIVIMIAFQSAFRLKIH